MLDRHLHIYQNVVAETCSPRCRDKANVAHLEKVHVMNVLLSAVLHSVVYLLLDSAPAGAASSG